MEISKSEILSMEKIYRANFVNSLSGFKSLNLIGSIDSKGSTNLAIFNSVFHLGANPPLVGMIVRPHSVERHTLENILETKFYTINHVNDKIYKQAHQSSARYSRNISEFDATGLTAEFHESFKAPFVKESRIKLGIAFKEKYDIDINNTVMVAGEIVKAVLPDNISDTDGFLNIDKAGTIAGISLSGYCKVELIERMDYAKP